MQWAPGGCQRRWIRWREGQRLAVATKSVHETRERLLKDGSCLFEKDLEAASRIATIDLSIIYSLVSDAFQLVFFLLPSFSTVWYFLASKHVVSDFRLHFLGAREMWRIVKCLANLFIFRPNFFTVYIELSSWIEGWLEVQRPHSGKTVSVGRRQLCLL